MNILHHKSWHVYNKDNIEKVKKDKAEAAEKEQRESDRKKKADKEKRLELLREKSKQKYGATEDVMREEPKEDHVNVDSAVTAKDNQKPRHINLFYDEEQANAKYGRGNEKRKREEKQKLDELERKHTIWHLDSGAKDQPWYLDDNQGKDRTEDDLKRRRHAGDPLAHMKIPERKQTIQSSQTASRSSTSGKSKIEILREQRMRREAEEKKRVLSNRK